MPYQVRYKPDAAVEVDNAIIWYSQPDINLGSAFVQALERTEAHIASHPELYQRVEGEIRRAVLHRFPYALFYVIESDFVLVLACMRHNQQPRTRDDLLGSQ